jgi:integrase
MFAEAKGWVSKNPAVPVVQILDAAPPVQHHPALLTFPELGDVLRRAEISNLSSAVRLAHRLIAFTCVRISNATAARWDQFDLDAAVPTWTIDREEMKVKTSESRTHAHRVVLPAQIRADLDRWREVQPKDAQYVFPGNQGRDHLTREAIEKALRVTLELDGKHSPHGWRAAFSTRAREDTDFAKELIDLTLDHVHASETALAYDRGQRLEKRIELMKWWGDALSQAERGCVVVPLRSVA